MAERLDPVLLVRSHQLAALITGPFVKEQDFQHCVMQLFGAEAHNAQVALFDEARAHVLALRGQPRLDCVLVEQDDRTLLVELKVHRAYTAHMSELCFDALKLHSIRRRDVFVPCADGLLDRHDRSDLFKLCWIVCQGLSVPEVRATAQLLKLFLRGVPNKVQVQGTNHAASFLITVWVDPSDAMPPDADDYVDFPASWAPEGPTPLPVVAAVTEAVKAEEKKAG